MKYKLSIKAIWIIPVALCVMLLGSCNPEKQAQKKDDKAYARVLTRPTLEGKIYAAMLLSHPCVTDSGKLIIKRGETIYKNVEVPTIDSVAYRKLRDSLLKKNIAVKKECEEYENQSYETGYNQGRYECSLIKIPTNTPDTNIYNIRDKRLEDFYKDSLNYYRGVVASKDTEIANNKKSCKNDLEDAAKKNKKLVFWIIGLAATLVIGIVLRIKKVI